ncbi:MAG TPA: hypothetical protein DHU69_05100 [Deltaproteobacteria bacterium]|nr:MAG: hypothetical protein A2090_02130 [Deltaproteobacteria bacterium GWD2_42_10]OGP47713.1 MAG: hypothetical protein A2022_10220 [Deltaproteobacteria bacterium GWF2_42_12]HAG50448.1 hypothetical protein [Deltaproteobacteria bacterium]HCY19132.1 hypothetical protein [Deltaproteobacteria bacterium]
MNDNDLIHSLALLVSGSSLFVPYMLISKIAENIDKFGSDNYGKRMVTMKVLSAQSGGVILFYGCYIITIGFIAAFLSLLPNQHWFGVFLGLGVAVSVIGLRLLYCSLINKDQSWLDKKLPEDNIKNRNPEERQSFSLVQNFNCSSEKKNEP